MEVRAVQQADPRQIVLGGQNNIVRFGVRERRRLLQQLDFEQRRLQDLGSEATNAVRLLKLMESLQQQAPQMRSASARAREAVNRARADRNRSLERSVAGRLDRFDARVVAGLKRSVEIRNPGKKIRVPKGTSQQEYAQIVQRIVAGDREAKRQYLVRVPKRRRN